MSIAFACNDCPTTFNSAAALVQHIGLSHKDSQLVVQDQDGIPTVINVATVPQGDEEVAMLLDGVPTIQAAPSFEGSALPQRRRLPISPIRRLPKLGAILTAPNLQPSNPHVPKKRGRPRKYPEIEDEEKSPGKLGRKSKRDSSEEAVAAETVIVDGASTANNNGNDNGNEAEAIVGEEIVLADQVIADGPGTVYLREEPINPADLETMQSENSGDELIPTIHAVGQIGKKFECEYCRKVYLSISSLRLHIRQQHLDTAKKYVCPFCGFVFLKPSGLREHVMKNSCQERDEAGRNGTGVRRREAKAPKVITPGIRLSSRVLDPVLMLAAANAEANGAEATYGCDMCAAIFQLRDSLRRHYSTAHPKLTLEKINDKMKQLPGKKAMEPAFRCHIDNCHRPFVTRKSLKRHYKTIHPDFYNSLIEQTSQVLEETHLYACSKCQMTFETETLYLSHRRACGGAEVEDLLQEDLIAPERFDAAAIRKPDTTDQEDQPLGYGDDPNDEDFVPYARSAPKKKKSRRPRLSTFASKRFSEYDMGMGEFEDDDIIPTINPITTEALKMKAAKDTTCSVCGRLFFTQHGRIAHERTHGNVGFSSGPGPSYSSDLSTNAVVFQDSTADAPAPVMIEVTSPVTGATTRARAAPVSIKCLPCGLTFRSFDLLARHHTQMHGGSALK